MRLRIDAGRIESPPEQFVHAVAKEQENWQEAACTPTQELGVILTRKSIYHISCGPVLETLDKFSKWLKNSVVFIVRLYSGKSWPRKINRHAKRKLDIIKRESAVVNSY